MMTVDQTSRIEDLESKLLAQKAQLEDLATMGAVITSILEINAVLSVTIDMAIRLVNGEVGLIMLAEGGKLKPQASWGVSEDFVRSMMYADGMDLASYCYTRRETVILADLEIKSPDGMVLNTVIASPIQTRDTCLGVLIIINKTDGRSFEEEDREVLGRLLNFLAVAVENSQLVKNKLQQQKIAQEMAIARQIQETILPQNIGGIIGAEIGAVYFPAREVGGDFYEILKISPREFMVVIGDVSNKGVPAALIMSACSAIIKTTLADNPTISVSHMAEVVNDLMATQIIKEREMFVTLFFSKFDLAARRMTFCNAGHMPGLFWCDREQSIEQLSEGGPILGQFAGTAYRQGERSVEANDRLFLYTDGLTEAMDAEGNLFGRERAEQVLTAEIGLPPNEFCLKVKEWVDRFSQGAAEDTQDDFTIVQLKIG
jgi:sigma-B regulation protein RsbU (phosphoserine phosphatase)